MRLFLRCLPSFGVNGTIDINNTHVLAMSLSRWLDPTTELMHCKGLTTPSEGESDVFFAFHFLLKWVQDPIEKRHHVTSLSCSLLLLLGVAGKLVI